MRRSWSWIAIGVLAAAAAACSGSSGGGGGTTSGGGGTVRVSGTYAPYAGPIAAVTPAVPGRPSPGGAGPGTGLAAPVDQVLAVPLERGRLSGQLMGASVAASLAGGTFSLDLPKRYDWLLLLVDSSAADEARFHGAVNLRTALDAGLIELPVSGGGADAVAVGTVAGSASGDATSISTVSSAAFALTPAQLESLAQADDLFQNAKNLVNNHGTFGNGPGVWYQLRPDFVWDGETDVSAHWSDPAALVYGGMQFQLDTSSTAVGMDRLCSHSTVVTLEPPSVVTVDTGGGPVGYGPGNGFTSAGATCTAIVRNDSTPGREFWSGSLYGTDGYGGMSYSVAVSIPTNPAGYWTWREGGTVRAKFDVSGVNPPVVGGKPAGFVPSYKVNVDATGRITSVDVRWFSYDRGAGTYTLLAAQDLPLLRHFVESSEVKLERTYGGVRETEEIYFDPVTTTRVIPAKTWYYGRHPADPARETGLMGFHGTGGFGFFFNFRPPLTP
jgi:hypothetical protein